MSIGLVEAHLNFAFTFVNGISKIWLHFSERNFQLNQILIWKAKLRRVQRRVASEIAENGFLLSLNVCQTEATFFCPKMDRKQMGHNINWSIRD